MLIVRGGGDLATGTIYRLWNSGYKVLVLESAHPTAIRRKVSVCEAVYEGRVMVEDLICQKVVSLNECEKAWELDIVPLMVDPEAKMIWSLKPEAVVDAIIAKKNLGTTRDMAPITVALGPGFCAGKDVDYCIETKRGHRLGRIIEEGFAAPNTGIPGLIAGFGAERVIHAPLTGRIHLVSDIGDIVEKGQVIAKIDDTDVTASLTGVLRGIIREGFLVKKGMKIADIDPRKEERENCDTISDKARCISGSVLEIMVRNNISRDRWSFP